MRTWSHAIASWVSSDFPHVNEVSGLEEHAHYGMWGELASAVRKVGGAEVVKSMSNQMGRRLTSEEGEKDPTGMGGDMGFRMWAGGRAGGRTGIWAEIQESFGAFAGR